MDESEEQVVVSGALSYQEKPLSAYQADHTTARIFAIAVLSVIALTVVATFALFVLDGSHSEALQAAREIATAVIAGLVGVLAGASMKTK